MRSVSKITLTYIFWHHGLDLLLYSMEINLLKRIITIVYKTMSLVTSCSIPISLNNRPPILEVRKPP